MPKPTIEEKVKNIIANGIYANQTGLVEMLLKKGCGDLEINDSGFTYDNLQNLYIPTCENCGHENTEANDGDACEECGDGDYSIENPQEVFQWLLVADWLYACLAEIGEPTLETDHGYYWGRTCCGLDIEFDGTIQKVIELMEAK